MESVSSFLKTASAVFAALPGVAVLISNVGVPPNSSTALFSATIEALGVLTLLILWTNRKAIRKKSEKSITRMAFWGIGVFLVSFFTYLFLFGYLVVDVPNSNSLFFPLWPEGELSADLATLGSRSALITEYGRDDVAKLIEASSSTSLLITTLILLFIYQLIFVALTFAFGVLGIKSSPEERKKPN